MTKEPCNYPWSVAIFAARESVDTLLITTEAVLGALRRPTVVNVLINGNKALSDELPRALMNRRISHPLAKLKVWWIEWGDKAHAWNQYLRHIWAEGQQAFFVDGYVRPHPSAIGLLEESITFCDHVFAATGLPGNGRTAKELGKQLLETHGLHGNLFCVKTSAMMHMKETGFHLPRGIYRTDATLGAAIKFGFDPSIHKWDIKRIFVHPDVTWSVPEKFWWNLSEVRGQLKRYIRQAQGDFENRAVRFHYQVRKHKTETLPETVCELVDCWILACPEEAKELLKSPLHRHALSALHEANKLRFHDVSPILMFNPDD